MLLNTSQLKELYNRYDKKNSSLISIPFSAISDEPLKFYKWYAALFQIELNVKAFADVDSKQIIIYKGTKMKYYATILIPYENREAYIDAVNEINQIVSSNGCIILFVCNIPYNLVSYLSIEAKQNEGQLIENIIKKYDLRKEPSLGLHELFMEFCNRKFNMANIPPSCSKEDITQMFSDAYFFCSKSDLTKKGYNFNTHIRRKKVFISYCHANKELVYEITEALEYSGIDLWIDKKDISVGSHLLESILAGIEESDFAILFLSNATLSSNYGQLELKTIMSALTNKKKGWYIVKIDDVDVNNIMPSLGDYKYYDLSNGNKTELIKDIINAINAQN